MSSSAAPFALPLTDGATMTETPHGADHLLDQLSVVLRANAHADAVFGTPRPHGERLIIPVASLVFAHGAGSGRGTAPSAEGRVEPGTTGSGGGGGVLGRARPIGVIEVSAAGTRFVPTVDVNAVISRVLLFAAVIVLLGGRFRRRRS
jgi:uncharacterized spore protein YtfJ